MIVERLAVIVHVVFRPGRLAIEVQNQLSTGLIKLPRLQAGEAHITT